MVIIGAGLCRTGTSSTLVALENLELGPVYHYNEVMVRDLMGDWMEFINGNREPIISDLKKHGYQSTLDLPVICFFDDLMEEFPKAKVLLTVRDSAEAWVKSFRNTVWQMQLLPDYCAVNVLLGGSLADQSRVRRKKKLFDFLFKTICDKGNSVSSSKVTYKMDITDAELETMYENWITYVKSKVPSEKLLIFNAKDGIDSLATFCGRNGVNDQKRKMPYANDTTKFNMRKNLIQGTALAIIFLILIGIIGVLIGSSTLTIAAITGFMIIRLSSDQMFHRVVQKSLTSKPTE